MDRLEKYIEEHRDELDHIEQLDADALWVRMQQPQARVHKLSERKQHGWQLQVGRNWLLSAAATVLLMLGVATWVYLQSDNTSTKQELTGLRIQDYYPEIAEEEMAFRRTIARKEAELDIQDLDRQQFIDIFNELDELERIHRQQLEDLPEVFDNEEWIRTLMQYYEQKLRILEHLSRELDKQQQQKERHQARSI